MNKHTDGASSESPNAAQETTAAARIEVGQRWYVRPRSGAIWTTQEPIRVMAFLEGFVVARFEEGYPMVYPERGFRKDFDLRALPESGHPPEKTSEPNAKSSTVSRQEAGE